MSKQEIKKIILTSIKKAPHLDRIKRLALFGSYLSDQHNQDSDVDLLIEFSKPVGFFKLIEIQEYLKDCLKRKVDLVTPDSLSKYFRADVLKQAENIYDAR